jgi:hypothetical protein
VARGCRLLADGSAGSYTLGEVVAAVARRVRRVEGVWTERPSRRGGIGSEWSRWFRSSSR